MTRPFVKLVEEEYLKSDVPVVSPGDTVIVKVKIREGNKERIQAYQGVVIKKSGTGTSSTVTVRRIFQGVGIERTFLIHSPKVHSIEIVQRGKVRRAKLYYLRKLTGKAARIKRKN
ncbi:MAG: 50S ribosomal protein L19 [Cyanobacteria bacterium P01_H01_bin.74]